MYPNLIFVSFSLVLSQWIIFIDAEVVLENVESLNGTGVEGYYLLKTLRIAKFNRSSYALNIDLEFFVDLDNNYQVKYFEANIPSQQH